jgi:hypothetical protein
LGVADIAPKHDILWQLHRPLNFIQTQFTVPTISNLHQFHTMSFLTRPASMLRTAALRPALSAAPKAHQQIRWGTSDYGSGDGNPAGETPQKQGANRSESIEHPGPAPPDVAKGKSSSSPNQDTTKDSQKSSSSPSKSQDSASKSGSNKGAEPKILSKKSPAKEDQSEEVKKHNKEIENRAEKQAEDKLK